MDKKTIVEKDRRKKSHWKGSWTEKKQDETQNWRVLEVTDLETNETKHFPNLTEAAKFVTNVTPILRTKAEEFVIWMGNKWKLM